MSEYDQRGISRSQTVAMMGPKRWGVSARLKQNAIDYLERTIEDPMVPDGTKMKAVECLVKMDMIDVTVERDGAAAAAATAESPSVVLLLPPNGTEHNT